MGTMTIKGKTMRSVDVDWKEFYYTNCPLMSPSNVDQEIGWVKEEFKKIGIAYKFLRSTRRERLVPALRPQPRQPDALSVAASRPSTSRPTSAAPGSSGTTHVYEGGVHAGARP